MTPTGQTVCLCMIVKNEARVIRRCLDSVRPLIDHWIIVDTGSSDGTQDIVRAHFADVPGTLVERPWRDFAHNRTESLALARPHGDYTLIIDADDTLEIPDDFRMPVLEADAYTIDINSAGVLYQRPHFIKAALGWRFEGVLHEYLECEAARSSGHLPVLMRIVSDGARRNDPTTYAKDAAVLEKALETETSAFLRARYTFYLAQSYRDSGATRKAIAAYLDRAAMGFWAEEVFVSLHQAGRLMEGLGDDPEDVLAVYQRASDASPSRAEALHDASRLCRNLGYHERGHAIGKQAVDLPAPPAGLFVEPWIYDYGALDEFAVNAYWAGYYRDCLDASVRALASGKVPPDQYARFADNARFALDKIPKVAPVARAVTGPVVLGPARAPAVLPEPAPRVLVAILAKQKESVLPLYLRCIEALDYPKSRIVLAIRTNNNTDRTREILADWVARVGVDYAQVEFDVGDVAARIESFGVHEWNATRFEVLAAIRNASLRKTIEHGCAYYFVADVDNFVGPQTLRELVAANLPIVAPLLRHVDPDMLYSNYHAAVDANGYYKDAPSYQPILYRETVGLIDLPVVHCTYLIRADQIARLRYDDESGRHEYVVFSAVARQQGVPQYLDNRQIYGLLTLNDDDPAVIAGQLDTVAAALGLLDIERAGASSRASGPDDGPAPMSARTA